MIHKLKIQEEYLRNIISGTKKAEVRLNDKDYQVGDILDFCDSAYSFGFDEERSYFYTITHIHSGLGLEPKYVVLSISQAKNRA